MRWAGVKRYKLDKELHAKPHDHFYALRTTGRLQLVVEPLDASELRAIHDQETNVVYYPDGGAKFGIGHAAYAKFRGGAPQGAEVWTLLEDESDPYTAEQEAILECLRDAERETGRDRRVLILTDSLSNIASLLSAGPRDRREQ